MQYTLVYCGNNFSILWGSIILMVRTAVAIHSSLLWKQLLNSVGVHYLDGSYLGNRFAIPNIYIYHWYWFVWYIDGTDEIALLWCHIFTKQSTLNCYSTNSYYGWPNVYKIVWEGLSRIWHLPHRDLLLTLRDMFCVKNVIANGSQTVAMCVCVKYVIVGCCFVLSIFVGHFH